MKLQLLMCLLFLGGINAAAQAVYIPPPASAAAVAGVDFASTRPIGERFRSRFRECDTRSTCEGRRLRFNCRVDPSRNTALLRLPDGTIFFDGKMGLDADGSPLAKRNATGTDQPETSFRFEVPGRPSVDADKIPFIVLPGGGFAEELGLQQGDIAAAVFNGKVVFSLVADAGPKCKIGEGSIQLHEELGHRVCLARNGRQECTKLRNAGIAKDVLYFVFPRSRIAGLTPVNARQRIAEEGERLFNKVRGIPR
ncbi:MAG: glycoside hydrolase family 75 protein [Acidobacteriota bacterium]|nr:glycoside hydrolase family 75 protein [Acidobacteriota bacterium]